jgi:hypothetical protein
VEYVVHPHLHARSKRLIYSYNAHTCHERTSLDWPSLPILYRKATIAQAVQDKIAAAD